MCNHCEPGVGCKIYKARPFGCASFTCRWLEGHGKDEDRPDKAGVVIDTIEHQSYLSKMGRISETRPGALQGTCAQEATDDFLKRKIAVMHFPEAARVHIFLPEGVSSDIAEAYGEQQNVAITKRMVSA